MHTHTREDSHTGVVARSLVRQALAVVLAAAASTTLVACGGNADSAGQGPPAGRGANAPANGAGAGGRPALPTMAVAVEPAARGGIATFYKATASLDPDKQADILARTSGVVEQLMAEEGDRVAEGQVLLHIEDDEYRHRLTLAEIDVEQQRLRYERAEKMFGEGLTSTEDFDTVRRDLHSAEAARELAALELSYTNVRAPFAGRVVRRSVDVGQSVSNGSALFTVADMSRLLARVHVPAKQFRSIRADQPVQLVVTSVGDRLDGRIDLVSPMVDPDSGTIKVTVEVTDYPQSTRPGDFVEVSIVTDRHGDALLVPRVAVVSERGQRSVYVADGDTAHQRSVEVGFEDDVHAEIVAGLDDGELVVVQGQRALRDGQPITVLERMDLSTDDTSATAAAETPAPRTG